MPEKLQPLKNCSQNDKIEKIFSPMSEPEPKPEPKPKPKGWSNPALRMMGIPKVSLPSRNWMIFWSALASIGGTIAYDRYEQKQVRKKYMGLVEHLGNEIYDGKRLPRKLTIFIAPPPDDFLDVTMNKFKKYIKPVLNAAAIDFDILVANKQGDIRCSVSDKIRQLRKEALEAQDKQLQLAQEELYNKSWKKFVTETIPSTLSKPFTKKEEEPEEYKRTLELYEPKDVLGYYYKYNSIEPVRDDLNDESPGGIVCVGRGAYKEYLQGLHEGLLGPLERVNVPEALEKGQETTPESPESPESLEPAPTSLESPESEDKLVSPPPFINPSDYPSASLAPEFDYSTTVKGSNGMPVLFEQPIFVVSIPNPLGFANTFKKMYNFFTRRYLAEELGEKTLHIVDNKSRNFQYKDQFLAKQEEVEWPKKWVKKGKEKNSEWVQELIIDERVTSKLKIID